MSFSGIKMQKKEDCTLGDSYTSLRPSCNKILNGLIQHPLRVKLRHPTHNRAERRIAQKVDLETEKSVLPLDEWGLQAFWVAWDGHPCWISQLRQKRGTDRLFMNSFIKSDQCGPVSQKKKSLLAFVSDQKGEEEARNSPYLLFVFESSPYLFACQGSL